MNRRSFLSSLAAITPIGLLLANQKPKRYRLTDEQKRNLALTDTERSRLFLQMLKKKGVISLPPVEYKWIIPRKPS